MGPEFGVLVEVGEGSGVGGSAVGVPVGVGTDVGVAGGSWLPHAKTSPSAHGSK